MSYSLVDEYHCLELSSTAIERKNKWKRLKPILLPHILSESCECLLARLRKPRTAYPIVCWEHLFMTNRWLAENRRLALVFDELRTPKPLAETSLQHTIGFIYSYEPIMPINCLPSPKRQFPEHASAHGSITWEPRTLKVRRSRHPMLRKWLEILLRERT
jgi:hypothetical protein